MSGEETDGPVKRGHTKCLTRVPIGWVNSQLADLFTVVDSYRWAVQNEGMSTGNRGNKPLPRAPQPKTAAYPPAVKGLPRNWYNDQWFKAQPPAQRALLKAAPARPIPSLVQNFPSILLHLNLTEVSADLRSAGRAFR